MSSDLDKALSAKSDQLNADDLIGENRTIKLTDVIITLNADQKINISFEGDDNKPWRPSKTQGRIMKAIWGRNEKEWIGKRVTIFRNPGVRWGGQEVGGVFISHIEGIDKPTKLVLAESKSRKASITVLPLDDEIQVPEEEIDITPQLQLARDAAKKGTVAFKLWWKDTPECRDAAKTIMDELKKTASDFDAANDEQPM